MKEPQRFERTTPLLNPHQVNDLQNEKAGIEAALRGPSHISGRIENPGQMRRQAAAIDRQLHDHAPTPYRQDDLDAAVKREAELREKWTAGMPTQAEMRRCPAGAIDKHRSWERANKRDIFEWKNIRKRLHASGFIDDLPDARDVANIERYRPVHASHELPMDNKIVPGKDIFLPNGPIQVRNVMSEEDRQAMLERDAAIAAAAAKATVDRLLELQANAAPVQTGGGKK